MPEDTLEQVRLLSNLESNRHKLLQIVLFGQPELDATLAKPALRQLRDRITHAFRMRPLAAPEVAKYLSFRMRAAGYRGPEVFTPRAVRLVARASGGLTRRINILADKALLAAFTENTHAVTDAPRARRGRRLRVRGGCKPRRAGRSTSPPRRSPPASRSARPLQWALSAPEPQPPAVARRAAPLPPPVAPAPRRTAAGRRSRAAEAAPAARARARAAPQRRAGRPARAAIRRRASGCSASGSPRRASCSSGPPTSATRSSSSSPRTPTRRAWSASCCARANWCRSRSCT